MSFSDGSGLTDSSVAMMEMRSPLIFDLWGELNHRPTMSVMAQPPRQQSHSKSDRYGPELAWSSWLVPCLPLCAGAGGGGTVP